MKPPACTICGKPAVEKFKPFCSNRCATLDLGRWLGEGYKVAAEEDPDELPLNPDSSDEIH